MELTWVDDWPERRKRLEAFWNCEAIDRAILLTTACSQCANIPETDDLVTLWTDIDYRLERMELGSGVYYGGETTPSFWPNLGPGVMASYLGSSVYLRPDTCWFEHIVDDWDEFVFKLDSENRWWKLTKDMTRAAVKASKGRFFVSHTDIGGPTDILSHLRGPDKLCLDLVERPDAFVRARKEVTRLWFQFYNELFDIVNEELEGSCGWMGIWHPGRTYPLQCDFCCMISPKLFEDYVLPELVEQGRGLDQVIYHLDGPGAIKHLDALLATPEITGIQWIEGAGQKSAIHWMPLLKKIQKAGKLLNCWASHEEAPIMLEELSPRGLSLHIPGYESREEVDDLVKHACKAASDRKR